MSLAIMIDDAGDLPEDVLAAHQIYVVPINVMFGSEQYRTRINLDQATFYNLVAAATDETFPTTSQPTPYQFEEVYRRALADGADEILVVTVSEKLSGTYDSAITAAQAMADELPIHVVDSQAGSAAQGLLALVAAQMAEQGAETAVILDTLHQMRDDTATFLLIDSLEFAVRGGRVSSLQSGVASLLNIKPLMVVEDGLIVPAGRVRTLRRARERLVEMAMEAVGDRPVYLAALHANRPEAGAALLQEALPHFNVMDSYLMDLALSVAVHLGPGAIGIVAAPAPPQLHSRRH